MARKYTGIAVFFLVLISSLLLAGCAPQMSSSAQQAREEPASAALPVPESANSSQAEAVPASQLGASTSTGVDQTTFMIAGSVGKQSPAAWVVGGKTVLLSSSTQIEGNPGPQSQVDVNGSFGADGALQAAQISISEDIEAFVTSEITSTGKFEIVGLVTNILTDTWVIGTQEVLVDENTVIEPGLFVGSVAKAEGSILPDGTYLASEITSVTPDEMGGFNHFQFVGTLESMEGTSWLISGITVTIDELTRLGEGLTVGLAVKVKGLVLEDGTLLARHIRLARPGGPPPEETIKFTGLLTAMDGDLWTVSQISVLITTTTRIKGDPQIGDFLKVEGIPRPDGSVLAHKIVVVRGQPHPTRTPRPTQPAFYEFTGLLTAMDGNIWTVSEVSVIISDTTEIRGNPQISDTLNIKGILQDDGSVLAYKITVMRDQPHPTRTPGPRHDVKFTGIITAINGNTWIIDSTTVIVTPETEIRGDPQTGDTVKVKGIQQDDGTVLAHTIVKESRDDGNGSGNGEGDGEGNGGSHPNPGGGGKGDDERRNEDPRNGDRGRGDGH